MSQDYNPYAPPSETADLDLGLDLDPGEQRLATPGQRWIGAFLDNLIVISVTLAAGFPLGLLLARGDTNSDILWVSIVLIGLASVIAQAVLVTKTGQSIGKRIVKTRIIRQDGSNPGFVYGVLLRSWLPVGLGVIPGFGSIFGLLDAVFVFRRDRRTIHDHIAGTIVIQI